jgi:hypothetical protein
MRGGIRTREEEQEKKWEKVTFNGNRFGVLSYCLHI